MLEFFALSHTADAAAAARCAVGSPWGAFAAVAVRRTRTCLIRALGGCESEREWWRQRQPSRDTMPTKSMRENNV